MPGAALLGLGPLPLAFFPFLLLFLLMYFLLSHLVKVTYIRRHGGAWIEAADA